MRHTTLLYISGLLLISTTLAYGQVKWTDVTTEAGLGQNPASRLKFTDLNSDGRPDIVIHPDSGEAKEPIVYLHSNPGNGSTRPVYRKSATTGLPAINRGDVLVFADLDNDGHQDAVLGRYLDIYQDDYQQPKSPSRSAWLKGHGDGSFSGPTLLETAPLATTRAIAINDVNEDGLPDLFIGNWYLRYFSGYDAFSNDLLLQTDQGHCAPAFVRWPIPDETLSTDYTDDLGGRPTYGVAMPRLDDGPPMLLELNYGRRWNRLFRMTHREPLRPRPDSDPTPPFSLGDDRAQGAHLVHAMTGKNIAAEVHIDGDDIRHGRHPVWPKSHVDSQPRSTRPDEAPFRANGNTFDVAVGDIDNDGDFDLFVSTIIHAWAGDSSDRSRFLVNQLKETGKLDFLSPPHLSVDRIPDLPPPETPLDPVNTNYNQGDIYAELADLNNDGLLDLILCSSDYPDPPPHDERLRIYFQNEAGRFLDVTKDLGIDHVGCGMPSLADFDGDGDLDLLVGQSFNRLPIEQRRAAALTSGAIAADAPDDTPPRTQVRLFRNESSNNGNSLMIDLIGHPAMGTTRDAYGTIIRVTADLDDDPSTLDVSQIRQVMGPAGHAGKQHIPTIHIGLGQATEATRIEIIWPGSSTPPTHLQSVPAGHYRLDQADSSLRLVREPTRR